MGNKLLLDQGSGGLASHRLVADVFLRHLANPVLARMDDAALINPKGPLAVSTDSFTVDPIFFPGGDIGCLAVHGTVNDVAMLGAKPLYLTCGFILEEGFDLDDLERIVASMARAAKKAGVRVIAGDTKVVGRGAADKIFINTTGIGEVVSSRPPSGHRARPGDAVIVSGTLGDHGLTILSHRQGLSFEAPVQSDCASLNRLTLKLMQRLERVHVLRDPTRGGLATTLNEIAQQSGVGIHLEEPAIPVKPVVASGCEVLGLDPLYLANEGKLICILPGKLADQALAVMRRDPLGRDACVIGTVTAENPGKVVLRTGLGGRRLLGMLEGEQLPRIC
ncbi:Hydrogenase expression/formation protein HypE [Fundidesulfovibrio magnetotacticus]|uniref:Hydrogenase expression/formation protein HypE n=1 Tax=Fundidesulfovibrio magnetotacticus TaxID=2730080 RepID=A0A6V8M1F8_9BACT|nr:hydrogenase expression/formation protein HypE [Fundidesulfovibrio magnetotacticus]GFK96049.1 Hydrogenase expression/formation protein HypE [Fundidesulfovibrio magnetotacticus]